VCASKASSKPHKAAEERHLAPLELIHYDLCEMNGVLTKAGKRYFMMLIDHSTRFCYVYLLNTKSEALHYFKIYKAEVENQLERRLNESGQIMVESISLMSLILFVRNMVLFMRGCLPIHLSKMGLPNRKTVL
jgi:hypothetical protein